MHEKLTKHRGVTFVPKNWGGERILISNDDYCGKILIIKKGRKLSQHAHLHKKESMWVKDGYIKVTGIDTTNTKEYILFLQKDEILEIPRLCFHQIEALEDSEIIEFSTKDAAEDNIKVFPGDSQAV